MAKTEKKKGKAKAFDTLTVDEARAKGITIKDDVGVEVTFSDSKDDTGQTVKGQVVKGTTSHAVLGDYQKALTYFKGKDATLWEFVTRSLSREAVNGKKQQLRVQADPTAKLDQAFKLLTKMGFSEADARVKVDSMKAEILKRVAPTSAPAPAAPAIAPVK